MTVAVSRDELLRAHLDRIADLRPRSPERAAAACDLVTAWRRWPLLAVGDDLATVGRVLGDREARHRLMGRLVEALEELAVVEMADADVAIDETVALLRETGEVLERARASRTAASREVPVAV